MGEWIDLVSGLVDGWVDGVGGFCVDLDGEVYSPQMTQIN